MTNFSGGPISSKTANAACGGPQGGGMDSRRNGVTEVSSKYLAEMASSAVPAGYKKTEVGVIPKDWDVATIEELAGIVDPQPDHRTPPESSNGEPYIGISDFISSKEVDWTASRKIISKAVDKQEKSFQLQKGDIVFGKIGTIGVPKFVPQMPFRFALSANVILLQPKNVEPVYLMEFFYSELFQKTLKSELHSTSQAAFGMNKMRLIKLPLPPKEEQTAIANALSDVDALISELEKLIAKKQAIKTATMQQLLTGRTSLPQFALRDDGSPKGTKPSELGEVPEDWEVKTVFELAGYQKSLFDDGDWIKAEHITSNGIRLIQTGNIGVGRYVEKDAKKYIFEESFEKLKCKELHEGDLLICRLAEPAGRACILPDIGEDKVITSVDVTIFRPSPELANREFYNQYFSSSDWFKSVLEQVGGTTHKRISRGALGRISVCYPNVEEQTAIATILSDMDAEIQALEQRLSKTRQIKQGMMQELLTGKTRLPFNKD